MTLELPVPACFDYVLFVYTASRHMADCCCRGSGISSGTESGIVYTYM